MPDPPDSTSSTSSSQRVPALLNQNCNRLLSAVSAWLARNRNSNRSHFADGVKASDSPALDQGRVLTSASSTEPALIASALAQNARRYHWPRRTPILPVWQTMAWKSGPSPSNSVQTSWAQRPPSRPRSRHSCCLIPGLPEHAQYSGAEAPARVSSKEPLATRLVSAATQAPAQPSATNTRRVLDFMSFRGTPTAFYPALRCSENFAKSLGSCALPHFLCAGWFPVVRHGLTNVAASPASTSEHCRPPPCPV
jgi:hypothetical protein